LLAGNVRFSAASAAMVKSPKHKNNQRITVHFIAPP
jgi:hypothetical protein